MRIGLVSYQCRNRDTAFNMKQIERAMQCSAKKADILCFGEAFLQGFDALCWDYETDKAIALASTVALFVIQIVVLVRTKKNTQKYCGMVLKGAGKQGEQTAG